MMEVGESDREECPHGCWSILYTDFRATWHCDHKWHRTFIPSLGSICRQWNFHKYAKFSFTPQHETLNVNVADSMGTHRCQRKMRDVPAVPVRMKAPVLPV